ncbi:MAG: OmpH family outer membrane protein [Firmicutes bacterium]|jgi:outer membrane protein|nr:OmpH family outer membrane protein [Bacillota bacterium]HQD40028.1 OmpH family outer membrane protein [Bacillota bacterium]
MSTNKGWIIVGLIVAALIGGIGGFVVGKLTGDEKVGYIDLEKIMTDFPAYKDATSILRGEQVELEMKLQEESKGKTEEEKQKLLAELQEQLVAKDKELAERVEKDLRDAVKKVAADKKITLVSVKNALYFGGVDITDDVLRAGGAKLDDKASKDKK